MLKIAWLDENCCELDRVHLESLIVLCGNEMQFPAVLTVVGSCCSLLSFYILEEFLSFEAKQFLV